MTTWTLRSWLSIGLAACCVIAAGGCSGKLATAPVSGKVTYKGKPLSSGNVLFQPDQGPPARGAIQADGTYRLSTYSTNDGAVIGHNRAQVICVEQAAAAAGEERPTAKSLIPDKYSNYASSELVFEVSRGGGPYDIALE